MNLPATRYFSADVIPSAFVDSEIRSKVKMIDPKFFTALEHERRDGKRRKITTKTSLVPYVKKQLCQLLGGPLNRPLAEFEDLTL